MRHSVLPACLAAAWFIFGGGYNERYCASAGGWAGYDSCSYATMEQCRAYVSGVGGICRPNPMAFDQAPPPPPPKKWRKRPS